MWWFSHIAFNQLQPLVLVILLIERRFMISTNKLYPNSNMFKITINMAKKIQQVGFDMTVMHVIMISCKNRRYMMTVIIKKISGQFLAIISKIIGTKFLTDM